MAKITYLIDESSFLKRLESYFQSGNLNFLLGSGASMPAISVAGDIESNINELIAEGKSAEADLLALPFIEELEENDAAVSIGIEGDNSSITLGNYVSFLMELDRLLFERKTALLPRQANIFTTNYDMFIEQAASHINSLELNDGFDRSSPAGGAFKFAPERYFDRLYRSGTVYGRQAEIPTINLIKIHGSLSWRRQNNDIIYGTTSIRALSEADRKNIDKVQESLRKRVLILPNLRKFYSTLIDRTYYDLLRLFANSMERENAVLIVFGFSFVDEHILDITRRALRNPTSQIIIFSYSHAGALSFAEKFSEQRNVEIVAPEEGENLDFVRLNSMLTSIATEKAKQ